MGKIELPLNLKCVCIECEFGIMYEHVKKIDTDKDNKFVCIWFTDNIEPDLLLYAGLGKAVSTMNGLFGCIREASMEVVKPTLKRVK